MIKNKNKKKISIMQCIFNNNQYKMILLFIKYEDLLFWNESGL